MRRFRLLIFRFEHTIYNTRNNIHISQNRFLCTRGKVFNTILGLGVGKDFFGWVAACLGEQVLAFDSTRPSLGCFGFGLFVSVQRENGTAGTIVKPEPGGTELVINSKKEAVAFTSCGFSSGFGFYNYMARKCII